jgi:transglutaminase/protease-like cytokinesis protein 3
MHKILLIIAASLALNYTQAQNYKEVDSLVKLLKVSDTIDLISITKKLTKGFADNSNKARAIFYWVANNIAFDTDGFHNEGRRKSQPADVLKARKATGEGYANIFQEMCSYAGIRCLKIDGYAKYSAYDIENGIDEVNHAWNIVQLGQSPEQWYCVDAMWAAGYSPDSKMKTFTKRYTDEWFFTDKRFFALTHLARIDEWKMAYKNMDKKEFAKLPLVREGFGRYGGSLYMPKTGNIEVKEEGKLEINMTLSKAAEVTTVDAQIGEGNKAKTKPMLFTKKGNIVSFSIPAAGQGDVPVYIFINGLLALGYYVSFE